MLKICDLTKKYGRFVALDGVSFCAEKGHIYGFIGPNGAGKSTTLNAIAGVLSFDEGDISILGHDILNEPEKAKSGLGYLPEIPPLYFDMTVYEYLEFVALSKLVPKISVRDEVTRVMEKAKISVYADRLIMNLSKGTCQRVGIACAILGNPDVLILDEPTVGLDPEQIVEIRELISSLKENRVILISSHILSEIEEICDRIIVINRGRIICDESTERLLATSSAEKIVHLTVGASEKKIKEVLSRIERITDIEFIPCEKHGYSNVTLKIKGNADVREKLFFAFSGASCPIIELYEEKPSLENLYRLLIKNDDAKRLSENTDEKDKKQSFSILKSLFSQSVYEKNEKDDEKSSDNDDDTYRPLFR